MNNVPITDASSDCILKLIFDQQLYDEMTDVLLSFPERPLEFLSLDVQAHMQPLENITEEVSGFKRKKMIEVNTESDEAKRLYRYIIDTLPSVQLYAQLLPLLLLE
ncbi:MAG: hypothetical protein ISEC1_P0031 [Thiomicrorhabdus sp.]|nr:MAG: hypothetical protein ISEC1_P0031 [Thiomicrorhabdus sp.]